MKIINMLPTESIGREKRKTLRICNYSMEAEIILRETLLYDRGSLQEEEKIVSLKQALERSNKF